jgi:hypothetical protein
VLRVTRNARWPVGGSVALGTFPWLVSTTSVGVIVIRDRAEHLRMAEGERDQQASAIA